MDIASGRGVPPDGFVYRSIYEYILYIRRIPYIPYIRSRVYTPLLNSAPTHTQNLRTHIWLGTYSKRRRFGLGRASSRVLIPAELPPPILLTTNGDRMAIQFYYIAGYGLFTITRVVCNVIHIIAFVFANVRASRIMHHKLLRMQLSLQLNDIRRQLILER